MDRDDARAAVLTGVLLLNVLIALPSPDRLDHDRLGSASWVRSLAHGLAEGRRALLRPLVPVVEVFGVDQGWAMFASPDRTPNRLEVHADRGEGWEPVFVKNQLDHPALGPMLRDRRIRALYDTVPDGGSAAWWNLTLLVGRRLMDGDPTVQRVRVRLLESTTTAPWEPADPAVRARLVRVHDRLDVYWDEP